MQLEHWFDQRVAGVLFPLAVWVLINGLDDLFILLAAAWGYLRPQEPPPTEEQLDAVPERLTAVFVGVWREHRVIRKMIENNVTKLRYSRVEFFVGAYPNDTPTLAAVRDAMTRFPSVHLSVCPHNGGTSKADNMNWIYQRMLQYEREHGVRFEMILTHDAEDIMDPDALRWINYYAQWNDFVQIPVLALRTPLRMLLHGVYCDDFAEYQFRDFAARQTLGGFLPSNGVGTGFSRRALEAIAAKYDNRVFEPACLTEDYENGYRVHQLGFRQKFLPIRFRDGRPVATREYFPFDLKRAVLQRSRWTLGITLQSWEFHSARETVGMLYWFWRDRKGLINNLVSPLTNLLALYGATTWAEAAVTHHRWGLAGVAGPFSVGMSLMAVQILVRTASSWRIYGPGFAALVPLRVFVGNAVNLLATGRAIYKYARWRLFREPLVWSKTDHVYHSAPAEPVVRQLLGEILVEAKWISAAVLEKALATKPEGCRLGEHLLGMGWITENRLYTALAKQNDLPVGRPETVSLPVTRTLPAAVAVKWGVLPYRVAGGELFVASRELPGEEMQRDIQRFSSLEIRFQLVTPTEFEELQLQYVDGPGGQQRDGRKRDE